MSYQSREDAMQMAIDATRLRDGVVGTKMLVDYAELIHDYLLRDATSAPVVR